MPDISGRVHLTKRTVDAAETSTTERVLWDDEVRGFGLRAKPNGVKSYVLQYRNGAGRSRRVTIGPHGVLTAEGARQEARMLRALVAQGRDPAAERIERRAGETVEAFCERYLKQHAEPHKKPSSVKDDRMLIRLYIRRKLGKLHVAEVTRAAVVGLHQSMRGKPYVANRTLAVLSKMMNLAEKWGMRPDGSNPCRHVERYKERRRQRFLSSTELAKLGEVLAAVERENVEHASVVPAIRLLLFTGARRGEILGLRWEHVNWERQCLDLPDSKTGPKTVHVNAPALQVLRSLRDSLQDDSPWVIRGRLEGKPLVGLPHVWQRIRKRAELPDLRLHDLRHSYASVAAAHNTSLPIIGALLGHTQPQTTARYAHLAADPMKEANEHVGEHIAAMMKPKKKRAPVIELNVKQRRGRR